MKNKEFLTELCSLAHKHGVIIATGNLTPSLEYQYDWMTLHITDGEPSIRKKFDDAVGKAIEYPTTVTLKLNKKSV